MNKKELSKIVKSKVQYYYISKGMYYRPGSAGYTEYRTKAGVYTKEDAIKHAERCSELTLVPIDPEQHNTRIIAEVKDLLSRIIEQLD